MVDIKSKMEQIKSLDEAEALYPKRNLPEGVEVTRIAPSPTGMPHIGTAMQAVIDRALADKNKGIFILRIEDTDKARSVPGAEEALIEALNWLGTPPDEASFGVGGSYGPYIQSERLPLFKVAARTLVEKGHAYHCFCTEQRLEELRDAQVRAKMTPRYDRQCRSLTLEEVNRRHANGEASVVRMCIPDDGIKIRVYDEVRGEIEFDTKVLDDSVLLKSDGFPTYHLASVVDDHFMRVTTVVRGEEWISSAPKHILLYKFFGWEAPRFLHTVLLRDEQRRKLSKRSGDTSITAFRLQGYLPEGFRNFLTRVMWAHPENKDIYDFSEFSRLLNPSALPSTGPIADMKLLGFINGQYLARLTPKEMRAHFIDYLDYLLKVERVPENNEGEHGLVLTLDIIDRLKSEMQSDIPYTEQVFSLEPHRHQKFADVFYNCSFMFETLSTVASDVLLMKQCADTTQAASIVKDIAATCVSVDSHDDWDTAIRAIASRHAVKDKVVFMLARVAITGLDKTPPTFEIVQMLGKQRVHQRLDKCLERLEQLPKSICA